MFRLCMFLRVHAWFARGVGCGSLWNDWGTHRVSPTLCFLVVRKEVPTAAVSKPLVQRLLALPSDPARGHGALRGRCSGRLGLVSGGTAGLVKGWMAVGGGRLFKSPDRSTTSILNEFDVREVNQHAPSIAEPEIAGQHPRRGFETLQ